MFDFKKSDMKINSLGTFLNYLKDVQALLSFLFYFWGVACQGVQGTEWEDL